MLRFNRLANVAFALGLWFCCGSEAGAWQRPAAIVSSARVPIITVADGADACAVIDDALAETALGGAVERNTNPQSALPGMCAWRSISTPGDGLTVAVDAGGEDKYNFDRSNLQVRDLAGVGDQAFAFVSPAGFVQLGMMKGATYITIVLELQNSRDRLQRAEDLARAIAGRL